MYHYLSMVFKLQVLVRPEAASILKTTVEIDAFRMNGGI
jgi:hypothetical protein